MVIKSEYADNAFAAAEARFKATGVKVTPAAMRRFEDALERIAGKRQFKEGEKIEEVYLYTITNEAGLILDNIANEKNNARIENPADALMSVTDYLYAMAMQKLGSPDIPASFGPDMKENVTKFATRIQSRQELNHDYSYAETAYDKQRGRRAEEVWGDVFGALNNVRGGAATPSEVQKVAVQYQALQRRQNDHGFFWRMFHPRENAARTELLADMERSLKTMLGDNVNLMATTSLFLAESVCAKQEGKKIEAAFADNGMSLRAGAPAEAFDGMKVEEAVTNEKFVDNRAYCIMNEELRANLDRDINQNQKTEIKAPETETSDVPVMENRI